MFRLTVAIAISLALGIVIGFGIASLIDDTMSEQGAAIAQRSLRQSDTQPEQAIEQMRESSVQAGQTQELLQVLEVEEQTHTPADPSYGPHVHAWRLTILSLQFEQAVRTARQEAACLGIRRSEPSSSHSRLIAEVTLVKIDAMLDLIGVQAEQLAPVWETRARELRTGYDKLMAEPAGLPASICGSDFAQQADALLQELTRRATSEPTYVWSTLGGSRPYYDFDAVKHLYALDHILLWMRTSLWDNCHYDAGPIGEAELFDLASSLQNGNVISDWLSGELSTRVHDLRRIVSDWVQRGRAGLLAEVPNNPCIGLRQRRVLDEDYLVATRYSQPGATDVSALTVMLEYTPAAVGVRTVALLSGCEANSALQHVDELSADQLLAVRHTLFHIRDTLHGFRSTLGQKPEQLQLLAGKTRSVLDQWVGLELTKLQNPEGEQELLLCSDEVSAAVDLLLTEAGKYMVPYEIY